MRLSAGQYRALIVLLACGCTPPVHATDGPDASAAIDAGPFGTCRPHVHDGNADGHHNAGMDCMDGCHDHHFSLAGTLYASAAATSPAAGATITVHDGAGRVLDLVVQTDGNFHTSAAITFPVTQYASDCPEIATMNEALTDGADNGCKPGRMSLQRWPPRPHAPPVTLST